MTTRSAFGIDLEALEPATASRPRTRAREERQEELATGLRRLGRRNSVVVTERWLLVAGGMMIPVGALLVLAGWYGAAHSTRLWEEIPYLISGGLFGLALVIVGAACYFGYWLTRLVSGDRQTLEVLLRIEERLANHPVTGSTNAPPLPGDDLVATRTGTMYHRRGCPVVASRAGDELREVRAPVNGMGPCKICLPEGVPWWPAGQSPDQSHGRS